MKAWKIGYAGKHIDTVFYTVDCDAMYVIKTLINHDGYPAGIYVI
jgi:hypothetical protein